MEKCGKCSWSKEVEKPSIWLRTEEIICQILLRLKFQPNLENFPDQQSTCAKLEDFEENLIQLIMIISETKLL